MVTNFTTKFYLVNPYQDHEQLATELKRKHGLVMTTSVWKGEVYLRATFNSLTSSKENVDRVFELVYSTAVEMTK